MKKSTRMDITESEGWREREREGRAAKNSEGGREEMKTSEGREKIIHKEKNNENEQNREGWREGGREKRKGRPTKNNEGGRDQVSKECERKIKGRPRKQGTGDKERR